MKVAQYNAFCQSLKHTTHVVQWGGAHVWKVGGKVFAVCWEDGDELLITFKCSDMSYEILRHMAGCKPAPYFASRGMKWIQRYKMQDLDDRGVKDYLRASYQLAALGLTQKMQRALGFITSGNK